MTGHRWGKMKGGFHMITPDLDRAFSLLRGPDGTAILVQQIREASWDAALRTRKKGGDYPDPVPASLNFSRLARDLNPGNPGLARRQLYRALTWLIDNAVVIKTDAGLLVNKNVDEWPLSDTEKAFCRRVTSVEQAKQPVSRETHPLCPTGHTPCVSPDTPPVSHRTHPEVAPPTTPVYEARARITEIKTENKTEELRPPLSPPTEIRLFEAMPEKLRPRVVEPEPTPAIVGKDISTLGRLAQDLIGDPMGDSSLYGRLVGMGTSLAHRLQGRFDCLELGIRRTAATISCGKRIGRPLDYIASIATEHLKDSAAAVAALIDPPKRETWQERKDRERAEKAAAEDRELMEAFRRRAERKRLELGMTA